MRGLVVFLVTIFLTRGTDILCEFEFLQITMLVFMKSLSLNLSLACILFLKKLHFILLWFFSQGPHLSQKKKCLTISMFSTSSIINLLLVVVQCSCFSKFLEITYIYFLSSNYRAALVIFSLSYFSLIE